MTDDPVPADVREFILEHIDSVAQLEALLLLRKYPDQDWDIARVANRLYVSEEIAGDVLGKLSTDGFLTTGKNVYRYDPKDDARQQMIGRLADIYARYLIAVTNIIHSQPPRIHKFADAFKFRKDK